MLNVFPLAADAAATRYNNSQSKLAATDVKTALDELSSRGGGSSSTGPSIVAVIAGDDAGADVKAATPYVGTSNDIEAVIAQALADGYRSLLLVGTCKATATVVIDTTDAVEIIGTPNTALVGDLTVSVGGSPVRLDIAISGTVTDTNARVLRPLQAAGLSHVVPLSQAEYDILTPDATTLYIITDV